MDRAFQLPPTHSLVVALDHSTGMAHSLPNNAGTYLQAAIDNIEKLLHNSERQEITEYSLLSFGDDRLATQAFTLDQPPPFLRQIRRLKALGGAPLAEALRQAQHLALDEAQGDEVRIVVLSRGFDTCGGQPLEVALDIGAGRRLKWTPPEQIAHKTIRLEIVGLGVEPESADARRLEEIARAAGGRFLVAADPQTLQEALEKASGIDAYRFTAPLPDACSVNLVRINPGEFLMGSPRGEKGRDDNEGPQHPVRITRPFFIARTPVTMAQWQAVVGTRPWHDTHWVEEHPDHPAVSISWHDVQDFIERLNDLDRNVRYRMPTEAEWEYACHAGTQTPWFFGKDREQLGRYSWWFDNSWSTSQGQRHARAVGVKEPNPWGLYDLYGNVAEWVQDRYGFYSAGLQIDPQGPPLGPYDEEDMGQYVLRGGRYAFSAPNIRSAVRAPGISRRGRPGGLPATGGTPRVGRLVVEVA
jgi:formylglycine-generating enzyme required for sulfatase activity